MKTFKASNYASRSDLENAVRNSFGLTLEIKDAKIKGSRQELKRLSLSGSNMFWGIVCEESDPKPAKEVTEKPQRGKKHKSSINKDSKEVDINKSKETNVK